MFDVRRMFTKRMFGECSAKFGRAYEAFGMRETLQKAFLMRYTHPHMRYSLPPSGCLWFKVNVVPITYILIVAQSNLSRKHVEGLIDDSGRI